MIVIIRFDGHWRSRRPPMSMVPNRTEGTCAANRQGNSSPRVRLRRAYKMQPNGHDYDHRRTRWCCAKIRQRDTKRPNPGCPCLAAAHKHGRRSMPAALCPMARSAWPGKDPMAPRPGTWLRPVRLSFSTPCPGFAGPIPGAPLANTLYLSPFACLSRCVNPRRCRLVKSGVLRHTALHGDAPVPGRTRPLEPGPDHR
jgi:hypothetical protein